MRKLILCSLIALLGCVHIRYGEVEYLRFGKQEVAEVRIIAPDGTTLVLSGYRGGESVKPS